MLYRQAEPAYIGITMKEVDWTFGDLVRKLRGASGLKLEELAERAGLSVSAIHELEIGTTKEPKRATLLKLASAFGLTTRELEDLVPSSPVRFELGREEKTRKTIQETASRLKKGA